jgi:hypothetical protein
VIAPALTISSVSFQPATRDEVEAGVLGWVTCIFDGELRLEPMQVRRGAHGATLRMRRHGLRRGRPVALGRADRARARRLLLGHFVVRSAIGAVLHG